VFIDLFRQWKDRNRWSEVPHEGKLEQAKGAKHKYASLNLGVNILTVEEIMYLLLSE
jgi:hypothetical protein